MNELCSICMKPHNGSGVGNGDGLDHRWCYERQHPPKDAETIYQVARGCGDPVLAAEVISEFVGGNLGNLIVREFNIRMRKNWTRRCEP